MSKISNNQRGHVGFSRSVRAAAADGKLPLTRAAQALAADVGCTLRVARQVLEECGACEWHHTSKCANKGRTLKTIEEALKDEALRRATFEATTKVGDYTIRELREAFEAVQDHRDWKKPVCVWVHHSAAQIVFSAIVYFQADQPTVTGPRPVDGWVLIASRGYQA